MSVLAGARHRFDSWLTDADVPAREISAWVIVLSELITNAVEASPPESWVDMTATREPDRVVLKVRNPYGGGVVPRVPAGANPHGDRGRGLVIVRELSDGLLFEVTGDETIATCWRHTKGAEVRDASSPH